MLTNKDEIEYVSTKSFYIKNIK